jgi:hypothetical protein
MKLVKTALLSMILATLLGCVNATNDNLKTAADSSISQEIIDGKTTKSDIEKLFNAPKFSSFASGLEVWKYELVEGNPKASSSAAAVSFSGTPTRNASTLPEKSRIIKELLIIFDEKGIVKKHSYSTLPLF